MSEHPEWGSEYAPEACEACANSFGPCYDSQVMNHATGAILASLALAPRNAQGEVEGEGW